MYQNKCTEKQMCDCKLTCYFFGAEVDPSGEEVKRKRGRADRLSWSDEFYTFNLKKLYNYSTFCFFKKIDSECVFYFTLLIISPLLFIRFSKNTLIVSYKWTVWTYWRRNVLRMFHVIFQAFDATATKL